MGMVIEKLMRNYQLICQAGIAEFLLNKGATHILQEGVESRG